MSLCAYSYMSIWLIRYLIGWRGFAFWRLFFSFCKPLLIRCLQGFVTFSKRRYRHARSYMLFSRSSGWSGFSLG